MQTRGKLEISEPVLHSKPKWTNYGKRLVVFLFCLGGCVYQVSKFLELYLAYPTIVDIQVNHPDSIQMPAITFCNFNGFRRTAFCNKYPNFCRSVDDPETLCKLKPYFCSATKPDLRFPTSKGLDMERTATLEDLLQLGHLWKPSVISCDYKKDKVFAPCDSNYVTPKLTLNDNTESRLCFTLHGRRNFSHHLDTKLYVPKYMRSLHWLGVKFFPQEYFRPDRPIGAMVAIHSPFYQAEPFYEGFVIKPGHVYRVLLKVTENHLLPPPYDTNCFDYKAEWRKSHGVSPATRQICLRLCEHQQEIKECGCEVPNALFRNVSTPCDHQGVDKACLLGLNWIACDARCKKDCHSISYSYEVSERKAETKKFSNVEQSELHHWYEAGTVFLQFRDPQILTYTYRPKYEVIEVFSYIGGYIGIWLGISLMALVDFAESLAGAAERHGWCRIKKKSKLMRKLRRRRCQPEQRIPRVAVWQLSE